MADVMAGETTDPEVPCVEARGQRVESEESNGQERSQQCLRARGGIGI